jgi:cytochrome P450
MTTTLDEVYYDPYDVQIYANPWGVFKRLRDEAPLYYNDRYDFFAISRFEDISTALADHTRLISGRGISLDQIKSEYNLPPGTLVYEDEPIHKARRGLLSRVFTPKAMQALEPQVRDYCTQTLDGLRGADGFDFAHDIGDKIPMRVIGMLLGIPEEHLDEIKRKLDSILDQKPGEEWEIAPDAFSGEIFADYVEWRAKNPTDDLMTKLIESEFVDEHGTTRRLTRTEVLSYINILAAAGNETTGLLIGWMGKLLGDHPDQRRLLVDNPTHIPGAVEETLRYEPSSLAAARYVANDVELHGKVIPAGSALLLLFGSANRDERVFTDPDVYDVRRPITRHFSFSQGIHVCLGAALARLEARIVLEEVLKRFPGWQVDHEAAQFSTTNVGVRGWRSLPVVLS